MSSATRAQDQVLDGVQVPTPGTYVFDDAHTSIEFVGRHLKFTKVRGRFEEFSGRIVIDEDPLLSSAEVQIKAASLSTRNDQRDEHLRSPDFLDVENYPHIEFKSDSLEHVGGNLYEATGNLTVRDVTKPVTLDVELGGGGQSPMGHTFASFAGSAELDREDFGMTWNMALEAGGWLVSKNFRIEIETEAILQES